MPDIRPVPGQPDEAAVLAFIKEQQLGQASHAGSDRHGTKTVPISQQKMDNEPEPAWIGPLQFLVHALPPKKAARLQESIEQHWPSVIIFAALADELGERGRGVDYAATAAEWSQSNAYIARQDGQSAEEITEEDVVSAVTRLTRRVTAEAGGKPIEGTRRVYDAVAESLWYVADKTPNLRREDLTDLLEENLDVPMLADCLRVIWLAVGGFPGCMADRFGGPGKDAA